MYDSVHTAYERFRQTSRTIPNIHCGRPRSDFRSPATTWLFHLTRSLIIPATPLTTAQLRRRWRLADREERRQLIVDAAVRLMQKSGLESVTIRRVADCLGVGAMTLYTYVDGQEGLRLAMTQHGFDLLSSGCQEASTLGTAQGWRGSAKHYIRFAIENPHLYKLMFATESDAGKAEVQILNRGFEGLIERVGMEMAAKGISQDDIDAKALSIAGTYWIALHGLASLAIAGRLGVLKSDMDSLLDSLLERVAPT